MGEQQDFIALLRAESQIAKSTLAAPRPLLSRYAVHPGFGLGDAGQLS